MDEKQYNALVDLIKGTEERLTKEIKETKEVDMKALRQEYKSFDSTCSNTEEKSYLDTLREKELKEMKEEGRLLWIEHAIDELDRRLTAAGL